MVTEKIGENCKTVAGFGRKTTLNDKQMDRTDKDEAIGNERERERKREEKQVVAYLRE